MNASCYIVGFLPSGQGQRKRERGTGTARCNPLAIDNDALLLIEFRQFRKYTEML